MAKLLSKEDLHEAPKEILTAIFNEVKQDNVIGACLVGQTWCPVNNKAQLQLSKEYFVFKPSDKFLEETSDCKSIEAIRKIKRKYLNLKFECIDFRENFDQKYWEKHGKNIRGVEFIDCIITSELICHILNNCSNLITFSLKDVGKRETPKIKFTQIPELPYCTRVVSFSLIVESFQRYHNALPEGFLYTVCRSFPFMENLHFSVNEFTDHGATELPVVRWSSNETSKKAVYTLTDRILNYPDKFQSIEINVGDRIFNDLFCYRLFYAPIPALKNLRICLMWDADSCLDHDFFWQLTKLQHINFTVIFPRGSEKMGDTAYLARIMGCLLEHCPDLKTITLTHLGAYTTEKVYLNESITDLLMNSRLETLNCFNFHLKTASTIYQNYNLKHLCVKRPRSNWRYMSQPKLIRPLCKVFCNLVSLEVPSIDDSALQTIFKYQTQLKILILMNCDECSDYGFTGCDQGSQVGKSIQVMEKLECLKLHMDFTPRITPRTIQDFKIVNLTHLSVRISGVWQFWKEFVASLLNCPMIKDIHCYFEQDILDNYTIWADVVIYCHYLINLDMLYKDGPIFDSNSCEHIIRCCPSLRMFRCAFTSRNSDGQYFFECNQKNNKFERLDWDGTYEQYPMPL